VVRGVDAILLGAQVISIGLQGKSLNGSPDGNPSPEKIGIFGPNRTC